MKRRKQSFLTLGILVVAILIFYFNGTKQIYGNDEASIVKVINSIEGYEDKSIEILEIKDFDEQRIAAFLANNRPGCIEFTEDKKGNYIWRYIEVNENEEFSFFQISPRKMIFVTNNENEIAKMQVDINGQKFEQEFIPNKATVTWAELPQTDNKEYIFRNYKYFDKDGIIIKKFE
ncbi:hypothetical protein FZC76_22040 [Sutcliffiella horikoshii]|uniref:Uncharacterized protein n=1 Tax=Sutcliffiella horikoshii TaxID=79883 RepID=A0A5D4SBL6_9BACI|nr:hypothetical protein [Sutcliffiella horikoshii]TYS59514.1 hypothetical protein FZC76_22040 [Sutcliffiella horikoshii]